MYSYPRNKNVLILLWQFKFPDPYKKSLEKPKKKNFLSRSLFFFFFCTGTGGNGMEWNLNKLFALVLGKKIYMHP